MTTGLVVGKMYPPHKGHSLLINAALAQCDHVFVWICDSKRYPAIPAELRAEWLREIHPQAQIEVIDQDTHDFEDADSIAWAHWTMAHLGFRPDKVFSSEDYGDLYAETMGSEHVKLDAARAIVPVSATLIRSDPLKYLHFLEPPVRAWFTKKVCLVGAESTGKTTLANALAYHYDTLAVPEYGRTYTELWHWDAKIVGEDKTNWTSEEFRVIAAQQNEMEDRYARLANKVLFLDTDSWVTAMWHERYMNENSLEVRKLIRNHDLYILCDINTPFAEDGFRTGGDARDKMQESYREELFQEQLPFIEVHGSPRERMLQAITVIDLLVHQKFDDGIVVPVVSLTGV